MLNVGWEKAARSEQETGTPRVLHHFFEDQALRRGNEIAVEFAFETRTYAELDRHANQIANTLVKRGVCPGDLVALYLKKSPRLYGAMLGILKAGAGYVPIDPRFPLERIRAILEDSGARAIITEHALADELVGHVETPLFRLDLEDGAISCQRTDAPVLARESAPEDLCYVIYTSGSTGRPKGVMIEHRNAVAFARSLKTVYQLGPDDRIYQGFSTAFDASVEEIWGAFSRGGTLVVPTEDVERSPSDVADFINAKQITYFSTVPTMLSMIDRELSTVRTLVLGGEACSSELVARWATPGRRMLNTYGPTEATVVATWSECAPDRPVSIGVPLPDYSAYVLDEAMQPVAPGASGELFIGGPGVARGYMHLPELTDQRFVPNPFGTDTGGRLYRTYDHVSLGHDGELYFLGRLDDQIKIRGFRIELSEIESVLLQHRGIQAAAVRVVDTKALKELAAYVVCDGGDCALDRKALAQLLRERMPSYMVPQYLDVVSSLPTLPSGKIDRKQLPAPQRLLIDVDVVVRPQDDLEQRVAEAWQQAFRIPELSVESDFFLDLGGHSLLAAQAITLVRRHTGSTRVSVRDIYEQRTVRALAAHIRKSENCDGRTFPAAAAASGQQPAEPQTTPSEAAFASVHAAERWTTVAVQSLVAAIYYGIIASPIAYLALMATSVVDGHMDWSVAAAITTAVSFAAWPMLLLTSIAVKWIVVGRYEPGRYPLWSFYYLRWWVARTFQKLAWAEMFNGTPLMSLYWRAMGARIGRNVTLCTPHCVAFDVISIGDDTSIGLETQLLGYRVEDGYLIIAPTTIGSDCFIGMHCAIGLDTSMGNGARLDDMSLLPDGTSMAAGEMRRGIPALPADVDIPHASGYRRLHNIRRNLGRKVFGALHLALIYVMGYFLIGTALPSVALVLWSLYAGGPLWGIAAAFAAIPLGFATYITALLVLKGLIGRLETGTVPLYSLRYLRHWFTSYLLENTKTILNPMYATVYLPPLLRALGARIGKGVEVSTVSHICPDALDVGAGSFLADACLVGGQRVHDGRMEVGPVRIGSRTFIGNSALVPGGRTIGDDALIGVGSTPPADAAVVPDGTRWLGAPGFALPNTQQISCFTSQEIFAPSIWARLERAVTDLGRILLPGLIATTTGIMFVAALVFAYRTVSLWAAIAAVPVLAFALTYVAVAMAALVKLLLTGRQKPEVKPLWSRFIWHNEVVNGVYECVAATAVEPLMGTPLISPCLRMMGCRIGRWCFIETTLFSEFDLVEVGDRACLNLGATIQTHLFEDRVFKSDHLKIGTGCSIGNMGTVLYGTKMQAGSVLGPLSVLMKGENLPALTHWHGLPCERIVSFDKREAAFRLAIATRRPHRRQASPQPAH